MRIAKKPPFVLKSLCYAGGMSFYHSSFSYSTSSIRFSVDTWINQVSGQEGGQPFLTLQNASEVTSRI